MDEPSNRDPYALRAFSTLRAPVVDHLRVAEHLATNAPLPISEIPALQIALEETRRALAALDHQLEDTEATLEQMKKTRERMATSMLNLRSVLHPIRSIPDDILSEIFGWCRTICTQRWPISYGDSLAPTQPPWTLSQVCQRWRGLTLSRPTLWSNVGLDSGVYLHVRAQRQSFRLMLQLKRSWPCDLTVSLHEVPGKPDISHLLSMLIAETDRWRKLMAYTSSKVLRGLADCPFDRLTSVDVTTSGTSQSTDSFHTFQNAPALSAFIQSGTLFRFVVPMRRLTSYAVPYCDLDHLARLQVIEKLAISHDKFNANRLRPTSISPSSPLILPSLRSLSLEDDPLEGVETGLVKYVSSRLNAPALTTLDLDLSKTKGVAQLPTLSHPEVLTELSIAYGWAPIEMADLLPFLHRTVNLQALSLLDTSGIMAYRRDFVEPFTVDAVGPKSRVLLPRLARLMLNLYTSEPMEVYEEVVGILASRWKRYALQGDVGWCMFQNSWVDGHIEALEAFKLARQDQPEWAGTLALLDSRRSIVLQF